MSGAALVEESADSTCVDVRPYRSGDEHEIVRMLDLPFPSELSLEHWRWKIMHWPTDATNVWLGSVGHRVVFHCGGVPLRFWLDGCIRTAMVTVDVMTEPQFRRRGLLTRAMGCAFENWRRNGVAFTFGLPNERWGSRIAALGIQELFALQWLIRPLRPERLAARRFGMPWLRRLGILSDLWRVWPRRRLQRDGRIEIRRVSQADDSFDRLWENRRSRGTFSVVHDSAWVQWRFLSSPTRRYEVLVARRDDRPVGYYASRVDRTRQKTSAFLAALEGNDTCVLETLLADAIARSDRAGADLVATLAVPDTEPYELLRQAGFMRGPSFAVSMVPFSAGLSMERLRDPHNWDLSGADFDVV